MTCGDVTDLLDAFVDAELPPPMLVAVARHAAGCGACDTQMRELAVLHETLERRGRGAIEAVDLSGVWPSVEAGLDRIDARRAWGRRLRSAPMWGAVAAMAAGALVWMRGGVPEPAHLAARPARPNHAVIERIDSIDGARFELRRDRKYGTTLIMVSADDVGVGR